MFELDYKKMIAVIVIILAVWVIVIFYRVGREGVIRKLDYWRARWKIVLFWFVVAVVAVLASYYLHKYGVLK